MSSKNKFIWRILPFYSGIILITCLLSFHSQTARAQDAKKLDKGYSSFQEDLQDMQKKGEKLLDELKSYNEKLTKLTKSCDKLEKGYNSTIGPTSTGSDAANQLQQAQTSFNLQYLQVQNYMENQKNTFSKIESSLRSKLDAAKAALPVAH